MLDLIYFRSRKSLILFFLFLTITSHLFCAKNNTFLNDTVSKYKDNEYISLTDEKLILYANPSWGEICGMGVLLMVSGVFTGLGLYKIKYQKPDSVDLFILGTAGPATIYLCKKVIGDISMKKSKNIPYVSFDATGIYHWGELQEKWSEIEEIWIETEIINRTKFKYLSFYKNKKSLFLKIPAELYLPIAFDDLVKISEYYWEKYYIQPQN